MTEGKVPEALDGVWGTVRRAQAKSPLVGGTLTDVLKESAQWPVAIEARSWETQGEEGAEEGGEEGGEEGVEEGG